MSMLTPRGMGGQYKITGKLYPRMTRRRRRTPVVIAIMVGLAVLATAGWGVYHFTSDDQGTKAAICPTAPPVAPPTTTPALPEPSTITVNVYNATKRSGLAKSVSDALKTRGFVIGKVTNDPLNQTIAASAEIRHGFPGATPSKVVAAHVAGSTDKEDQRTDGTVDLVIGEAWKDLSTPEAVTAILSPPPPPPPASVAPTC
jgi:LytR cell envelope-related transcriptional attenuator